MNFDDLKHDINQSAEQATIIKPQLISRSNDLVQTIRSTMRGEIMLQLMLVAVFFSAPAIYSFAELPRAVYLIFTFIICVMTLSYIVILGNFLRQTSDLTANTRNALAQFIYEAKLSVSGYIAFVLAGSAMLPIIVFAFFTTIPFIAQAGMEGTFEKWFLLRLNPIEFFLLIGGFSAWFLAAYVMTIYWAQYCYGRHITKLDILIRELDAE